MTRTSEHDPASSDAPPRSVTDVLCREVGARHPDGALKQIRTMKRLLRSHYRVQQRLEAYGVEGLDEAASRIATLTRRLQRARQQQRQRARRRLTVIETLLEKMALLREQAPPSGDRGSVPPSDDAPPPLQSALDLVEALATELDELRLELWLHQSDDDTPDATPQDSTAPDLLDRLDKALRQTQQLIQRLHRDREALREENDRLRRETERLRQTVEEQQARIEQLRQSPTESPARESPPPAA